MGAELVLALRLTSVYATSVYPTDRALPDPYSLSRKRAIVTGDCCRSKSERNSDWKFRGERGIHPHQQNQQHQPFLPQFHSHQHYPNRHNHPWRESVNLGCHPGKLRSGFSIASEGDNEVERQGCGSSFHNNAECSPFPSKEDCVAVNSIYTGGGVAGSDLPFSLRILKRKQQDSALVSGLSELGNALLNAISSVVTMMKTLQSHTLHIWRQFFEQEIEGTLNQMQREMHISFVWLFQQVFACTPELMVLVMVLLADFAAFSVVNIFPVLPMSMNAPYVSMASLFSTNIEVDRDLREMFHMSLKPSPFVAMDKSDNPHARDGGWIGNGGKGTYRITGDADDNSDLTKNMVKLNKPPDLIDDDLPTEISLMPPMTSYIVSGSGVGLSSSNHMFSVGDTSDFSDTVAALAFEEFARKDVDDDETAMPLIVDEEHNSVHSLKILKTASNSDHFTLDQMTLRSLVAPLTARIDDDDYTCYDKTDLVYQDAISNDSSNSLLLTNYAQFLFLVRKDHDRAEELFRKAVACERPI